MGVFAQSSTYVVHDIVAALGKQPLERNEVIDTG